ncbi:sugar phosphate isomerase/epimerase family protein [Singulisphaera sp. GP187]|uniref:sugar phosphate isomerase/epimerase family protein n=1 Tax=Singulisphaera sp. GP187 TaxID=1882752 RepID=UPI0009415643|nr:sugar phosphate isomerase/epimerase family protein [Singulisphaera sp. GP187]
MSEFLYCLNTSTIRPTPLLEKIRIAGRLGYQALEPWNNEIDEYLRSGGTLPDLRNALADAGLKVVSVIALHGWVLAQGADYAKVKDDCRRRMEQAAALGSPSIVASPPQEEVDLDQAAARFGELLELGRQCGVTPSMEFLGFVAGVKNVASALAIATGSGDPRATVVADVFHMIRGGGSVDDLLALEGRQLACFHLNDLPASPDPLAQTDADRVMLGDGIADLPRVIANLRTIGFRGPLSLELFNPTLWGQDPFEVAKTGIERMKRLVER